MNKKTLFLTATTGLCLLTSCFGGDVNTIPDPHFDSDGILLDSAVESMKPTQPQNVKFFVEVSGSMNGFFRKNKPTDFKKDLWQILNYYSDISNGVTVLTNEGSTGENFPLSDFQTKMNTGAFVSTASTKVPEMLKSIINSIHPEHGEVAVMISDMKYSPVGNAAPEVLLSQYSTDVSTIFGNFNESVCLIGATSDNLDKKGNMLTDKSPYYYLIIGSQAQVAMMRNGISTILKNNDHFIDNIESGFDYGQPNYSFGRPDNCFQMDKENPTFVDFNPSDNDTCFVNLKVCLESYRWIMEEEVFFRQAFRTKALYGSNVEVGKVTFDIQNITDKQLMRTAIANVELKLFDMAQDSEVIEWSLELPDTDYTKFSPYFEGAVSEEDVTKSYSVINFIKGMFYGGLVNKTLPSNFILISQNS
ncbi:MAG: hypothetical protein J5965_15585 [Aeriscardovia sp.]|nr:hypothetical protein [Aeriscardovia sp.]MBP3842930.1 hypothetical protein [Prevotella sp.]